MATFPKNHDHLYFDALVRTQKGETLLALINATYHAYQNKKNNQANIKADIAMRLKNAYGLFRNNVKGYNDGIGSYDGEEFQFESQYTLGHEMAIWKNSDLELNYLAEQVAKNNITIKEYLDIIFLNYIQPIKLNNRHILYEILAFMINNDTNVITKNEIKNIFNNEYENMEAINALCGFLGATNYFQYEKDDLTYTYYKSIETLSRECNIEYIGTEGYERALKELDTDKYNDYISQNNKIHKAQSLLTVIGENKMFYGVPGCGKSYYIENELCSDIDDNHKERITFHPDYTYGDFVGQLLPQTDRDGKIKYEFSPGPFTRILAKAYENQDEQFVLIIEEINRGNAAAIFGDVFQLLDRQNGKSEYGISNIDILKVLTDIGYNETKIFIPNNLSIYATLNTSDQNVFVLDTAFKRRWKEELIENNIEKCEYRHIEIVNSVTWKKFFNIINEKIAELVSLNICEEDKMLGAFFVKEGELNDPKAFAGKVLSYLWNDVVKYHRDSLFVTDKYKTFEQLRTAFIGDDGFNIFDKNKIELIEEPKQEVAETDVD